MKYSREAGCLIANRAKREGEKTFLSVTVAFEKNVLVLQKRRFACQRGIVSFADHRPGFAPAFLEVLTHRRGMFIAANHPIAIIVQLNQLRPPDDANRQIRRETDADRRPKTLRPGLYPSERRLRPVHGADHPTHFPSSEQEIHALVWPVVAHDVTIRYSIVQSFPHSNGAAETIGFSPA